MLSDRRVPLAAATLAILAWSAIGVHDRWTWAFEIGIGLVGVAALVAIYPRFRFTDVVYGVVVVHFLVLAVGAKYTYALSPPGEWLRSWFGFERNHFDRVGHFMQGFAPALIAREVLLRRTGLVRGGWLALLVVAFCLAFSAFYEIVEWWVVLAFYADAGPEWLGHQGDPWDAQWDMTMALAGAVLAIATLARRQDAQLATIAPPDRPAL